MNRWAIFGRPYGTAGGRYVQPLLPSAPSKQDMDKQGGWLGILWGGGIAGAFDITYAMVANTMRGSNWVRTLQSVASGVLGREAFAGGLPTAALGLGLHFVNAFLIAAVYYAVSRKLALLTKRAALCGLLYGAVVYLVMSRVVVPLSAAPFTIPLQLIDLAVHMILIGLTIALAVRRFSA